MSIHRGTENIGMTLHCDRRASRKPTTLSQASLYQTANALTPHIRATHGGIDISGCHYHPRQTTVREEAMRFGVSSSCRWHGWRRRGGTFRQVTRST